MDKGIILFNGNTDEGIIKYENISKDKRVASINKTYLNNSLIKESRNDGSRVVTKNIGLVNVEGDRAYEVQVNEQLIVFIEFEMSEYCEEIYFSFVISHENRNTHCIWVKSNDSNKVRFRKIEKGLYRLLISFPEHYPAPGVYYINYAIRNAETGESYEQTFTDVSFSVKSDKHYERGIILTEEKWVLDRIGGIADD